MKLHCEMLRRVRENNHLTQKDVAKVLNTTQQVYSRYENGENEIPLHHFVALCRFYNLSADYLLGFSEVAEPPRKREK